MDDKDGYKALKKQIKKTIAASDTPLRVLAVDPTGEVVMDTSKGKANKFKNYQDGSINENHGDRQAIIDALDVDGDGYGFETKLSKSTGQTEMYIAEVMGESEAPTGVLRVS